MLNRMTVSLAVRAIILTMHPFRQIDSLLLGDHCAIKLDKGRSN